MTYTTKRSLSALLAGLMLLASPVAAQSCDSDGIRTACEPDTWQPDPNSDQSHEDSDLDDGRDIPDTPEPPEEHLDDGRGEYPDGDG